MTFATLIFAVLTASLLGSLHCVGMCGAFVALACGSSANSRGAVTTQLAYHLGRLVSYTILGAAAGAAGGLINLTGTLAGIRPIAASLAGATMAAFGIVTLLRLSGLRLANLRLPKSWTTFVSRASRTALDRPPLVRAGLIGLFTTLLPCGWLYAFAITAAGTAHPLTGALIMASFWLGTVPALAALGFGVRRALDPLNKRIPAITAIALIVIGFYTLTTRAALDPAKLISRSSSTPTSQPACCAP